MTHKWLVTAVVVLGIQVLIGAHIISMRLYYINGALYSIASAAGSCGRTK